MIYDIIMKLKKNRAPGEDGISAKLLKYSSLEEDISNHCLGVGKGRNAS
jgi:hypothetical protein